MAVVTENSVHEVVLELVKNQAAGRSYGVVIVLLIVLLLVAAYSLPSFSFVVVVVVPTAVASWMVVVVFVGFSWCRRGPTLRRESSE